jgi:hypothetical protein
MNVSWVLAEHAILPANVSASTLNSVAPVWSSWRHVRGYQVDNAVCYDTAAAQQLIDHDWHQLCNLYVPTELQQKTKKCPVYAFGGTFDFDIASHDDIVCLHLAASQNQVVLLLGFDLAPTNVSSQLTYLDLIHTTIDSYPDVQWVLVNHSHNLYNKVKQLTNLTCDSINNVLNLLGTN